MAAVATVDRGDDWVDSEVSSDEDLRSGVGGAGGGSDADAVSRGRGGSGGDKWLSPAEAAALLPMRDFIAVRPDCDYKAIIKVRRWTCTANLHRSG